MGRGRACRLATVLALSVGAGLLLAGLAVVGWRASGADHLVSGEPAAADPLESFCDMLSGEALNDDAGWYASELTRPPDRSGPLDAESAALLPDAFADRYVESTPRAWHARIRQAADGLSRALADQLTADEARVHIASFERLRRQATPDCRPYWDQAAG